jgi:hypothetical protein
VAIALLVRPAIPEPVEKMLGPLLDPRANHGAAPGRKLRTLGVWHQRFFGSARLARGGVIGIHGTNQPQLIPGRGSHGCVRVENPAISRLVRLMPIGTSVLIR